MPSLKEMFKKEKNLPLAILPKLIGITKRDKQILHGEASNADVKDALLKKNIVITKIIKFTLIWKSN